VDRRRTADLPETDSPSPDGAPPMRGPVTRLAAPTDGAFAARVAIILGLVLLSAAILTIPPWSGPSRYVIPGAAALILVAAYWRWAMEALVSLALIVAFYDTVALYVGGVFKQLDELTVAALVVICLFRVRNHWSAWWSWPREIAVALIPLMGVLSSVVAGVPVQVWLPAMALIGKPLAFFYVVLWSRVEVWQIRAAMKVVLAVAIPVVVLGFIEGMNPALFQSVLGLNEYIRARGESVVVKSIFTHPALFGYFTSLVALFLFAQYATTRRWIWLVLGLFMTLGPFLSARRRAIVALLAGITAGAVEFGIRARSLREAVRSWLPAAAGVVVIAIVFLPMLTGLYQLTVDRYIPGIPIPSESPGEGSIGGENNPQARIALYRGSVEIGVDYFPLGAGMGRYGSWVSRDPYSPLYYEYGLSDVRGLRPTNPNAATDTFWPSILGEIGAIGLAAYVAFLVTIAWMLWKEAGRADGVTLRVLRLGAGMAFAQAIMESVASSMFHSPPRAYLFFLVVGVVASLAWRRRLGEREGAPS
jgi:hypothetical protein